MTEVLTPDNLPKTIRIDEKTSVAGSTKNMMSELPTRLPLIDRFVSAPMATHIIVAQTFVMTSTSVYQMMHTPQSGWRPIIQYEKKAKKDGGTTRRGIISMSTTARKYALVLYTPRLLSCMKSRRSSVQMGIELRLLMLR